jgi:hypothetical protein
MEIVTPGLFSLEQLLCQDKEILQKLPLHYSKCANAEAVLVAVLCDGAIQLQQ